LKPILLRLGPINVYAYGLFMVIAYFAYTYYVYKKARRINIEGETAVDISVMLFISGIVGARLAYMLLNLDKYAGNWGSFFSFQKGGLSWHGGLFGAAVVLLVVIILRKLPVGQTLDLMFTPVLLALGIGRIGCFFNGCCYGHATNIPWAISFISHNHPVPVHPTQLYELILDFAVFGFLAYRWSKRRFAGENTVLTLGLYSAVRFIVEFFRYNTPDQMILGLSLAQWLSLMVFSLTIVILVVLRRVMPELSEISNNDETEAVPENANENLGFESKEKRLHCTL
jgi:phosphatidylglycerol---prolipoprotein diacylglyceryl transferase